MKKRLAISALVGALNFLVVCIVFNLIYTHWHTSPLLHSMTFLYATLFGAINAAATFGISFVLTKS